MIELCSIDSDCVNGMGTVVNKVMCVCVCVCVCVYIDPCEVGRVCNWERCKVISPQLDLCNVWCAAKEKFLAGQGE